MESSDWTAKEVLAGEVPAADQQPATTVDRWFGGDFQQFVRKLGPRLYSRARVLTDDAQLAEDAVSETCWEVYRKWNRISQMDNPDAYVQTVLTNQCYRLFRKSYVHRERPEQPADLPERTGPIDAYAGHDGDQRVGAALRRLSPQQRTVLYYRYFKDYSNATIAEIMGLSEGAVRHHAAIGQQRLRVLLADEAGKK